MPYYFLLFLIPVVLQVVAIGSWSKWLSLVGLLIFLKAYRDGFEITRLLNVDIGIQLIIALWFTLVYHNVSLFIFTAWEIGSLPLQTIRFRQIAICYYFSLGVAILGQLKIEGESFTHSANLIGTVIFCSMAIFSPLAARSVGHVYRTHYRLQQKNKRLEAMVKQSERERIAGDLHDNLGQAFSVITLKAELASKLLSRDSNRAQLELKDIMQMSRNNLTLVREIVQDMRDKTIAATLLETENKLDVAGIQLFTDNEAVSENWKADVQNIVSAIIQEGTTNLLKYSHASLAEIKFKEYDSTIQVIIKDNGLGMTVKRQGASGVNGMENRVLAAHGKFTIKDKDGVVIIVELPKELIK